MSGSQGAGAAAVAELGDSTKHAEAPVEAAPDGVALVAALSDFDAGFLVGILVGEGHFGGDARQPQITLRMHTDHAAVFAWLTRHVPGGRLYGPYDHSGRHYYQWMARGAYLRKELIPLLDRWLGPEHSQRANDRYLRMKARYGLGSPPALPALPASAGSSPAGYPGGGTDR